jgi:hypothetical protein
VGILLAPPNIQMEPTRAGAPTHLGAGQTVLTNEIVGWHIFSVLRTLQTAAPVSSERWALERPADVKLKAGEVP